MKKLFKTVAVVAAALAVGLLASCKTNVDLGADTATWKKIETDKTANTGKQITVTADNAAIDWYCWTDDKGQILVDAKYNPTGNRTIAMGESQTFTMPEANKEYRLNIYQSSVKPQEKDAKAGSKDFRGAIKTDDKFGKKVKASNYAQEVSQQAEYWFTNNEPQPNSFFKPTNGDYTIEEVWVLQKDPKDASKENFGAKYYADEGLKYKGLKIEGSENNKTKVGFLVPAGREILVAIEQPNRAKGGENLAIHYFIYKSGKIEVFDGYENGKQKVIETREVTKNDDGTTKVPEFTKQDKIDAAKHTEVKITSSQLKEKKAEYWGGRTTLAVHTDNKSENLMSFNMGDVKFDRIALSNDFTNTNGKAACGREYVTVTEGQLGEK